jgi:hypothetical protein
MHLAQQQQRQRGQTVLAAAAGHGLRVQQAPAGWLCQHELLLLLLVVVVVVVVCST